MGGLLKKFKGRYTLTLYLIDDREAIINNITEEQHLKFQAVIRKGKGMVVHGNCAVPARNVVALKVEPYTQWNEDKL